MKRVIKGLVALGIICFPLILAIPVQAASPPDSDPTLSNIRANINLLETGDVLIYGEYNIPYTSIPDEGADETYSLRLLDTDNSTQLGAISPYVQFDSGYNEGVFSFYFSATDNLSIDLPYTIRISQSPSHFASPQVYDYVMPLSAWTTQTTQEDNQTEFTLNIISAAQRLETAHDETLLEASVGGTVLSDPVGETYFRGAIYGVQSMAPDLFLVQVLSFATGDRQWTTEEFDEYQTRFDETWIGTATENTSSTFGVTTTTLMSFIFGVPVILGAIIISAIKFRRVEPGYMVAAIVLILLALMGWISAALFATIYQVLAIYIGYLLFYARG